MNLIYEFLTNNTKEKLLTKVKEAYLKCQPDEQGRPLLLKIMIDIFQHNSEEAAKYLISTVKTINISTFNGENVSLIRGATS